MVRDGHLNITAVSSIGAALGGVALTHHFTRKREERTAAAKLESERLYISTGLVFLLERFAQRCLPPAQDKGERDDEARFKANFRIPELSYASVSGDWRSLPPELLYQIQQLEVLKFDKDMDIPVTRRGFQAVEHVTEILPKIVFDERAGFQFQGTNLSGGERHSRHPYSVRRHRPPGLSVQTRSPC